MNQEKFLFPNNQVISHSSFWEAPSNIALIKYWGKRGWRFRKRIKKPCRKSFRTNL